VAPTNAESLLNAIDATIDPIKACDALYECVQQLTSQLVGLLGQDGNHIATCNNKCMMQHVVCHVK